MQALFVTGMLRSGTTLAQTALTNQPGLFVAYQPFHRLHVDVKRSFLAARGIDRALPLDDGTRGREERIAFHHWLRSHEFSAADAERLAGASTLGKGGGLGDWTPASPGPGPFATLWTDLLRQLARRFGQGDAGVVGAKEILCEEYVPALLDAGARCVLVLRDPRGVVASANHGRYRDEVGDRYPLLMLVRLWRKSAAYWLRFRDHPNAFAVRYEDLALDPDGCMDRIWTWLGNDVGDRPRLAETTLLDHAGRPWAGNSSFGDKPVVDGRSTANWRDRLRPEDQRFIAACARWEMLRAGYDVPGDIGPDDIGRFEEDLRGVRESHLASHRIDADARHRELRRLQATTGNEDAAWLAGQLLFPELVTDAAGGAR